MDVNTAQRRLDSAVEHILTVAARMKHQNKRARGAQRSAAIETLEAACVPAAEATLSKDQLFQLQQLLEDANPCVAEVAARALSALTFGEQAGARAQQVGLTHKVLDEQALGHGLGQKQNSLTQVTPMPFPAGGGYAWPGVRPPERSFTVAHQGLPLLTSLPHPGVHTPRR